MNNTVSFVLCIHNHQPEGNFDSVFQSATEDAYRPFLELLGEFPSVKVTLHFTGILLNWLENNNPEVLQMLHASIQRGQVELLSGGFHEPILPVIPDEDKIGQIGKLTTYIDKHFNIRPRGMWLAERIWEQSLVKPLAEAGIEFTLLDDTHFLYAGLQHEELTGYFITEEQGYPLKLFPIDKELRYLIPFGTVEKNLAYFRNHADSGDQPVLIYADDGEKFGVWPETKEHVWEDGWLRSFFQMLDQNRDWIVTKHFHEVLDSEAPKGRVYLPDASYAEMMKWALPTAYSQKRFTSVEKKLSLQPEWNDISAFLKGGFWRNFLVKYPEINQMHKKMLRVSRRFHDYVEINPGKRTSDSVIQVRDYLWAAQCNCAYWHGVFGGLYLPHIRHEVFKNLIHAERILDKLEERVGITCTYDDFDFDGNREIIVETPNMNTYFSPNDGGKLTELDFKPSGFNVLNVMTRREEAYHSDVNRAVVKEKSAKSDDTFSNQLKAKEAKLEQFIHYDWYRKGSFVDHIFSKKTMVRDFSLVQYQEYGDFANQPYEASIKESADTVSIILSRNGGKWTNGKKHPIQIDKHFIVDKDIAAVRFRYILTNKGTEAVQLRFGIEFNMNMLAGKAFDRYYRFDGTELTSDEHTPDSVGSVENAKWFSLTDEWDNVVVYTECNKNAEWWRSPVETVSLSEGGFERTYQGATVVAVWDVLLEDAWEVEGVHRVDLHHNE